MITVNALLSIIIRCVAGAQLKGGMELFKYYIILLSLWTITIIKTSTVKNSNGGRPPLTGYSFRYNL